jgi:hypothetical protein
MSHRFAVAAAVAFLVAVPAAPAFAQSQNAACPGQNLPEESQLFHPLGQTVAKPVATSEPGAVGDFVSTLAHSEEC